MGVEERASIDGLSQKTLTKEYFISMRRFGFQKISQVLSLSSIYFLSAFLSFAAGPAVVEVPADSTDKEIQQALDSLPAEGGEVVLAAGKYDIHSPIFIERDNQTLRGCGAVTILRLADSANCPVVILGAPMEPSRVPVNIRLAKVFIDGNRQHQNTEFWKSAPDGAMVNNNGVNVWESKDAVVEGVICCHCRSGGLVTAHKVRGLAVRDFEAYENQFDGLACYQTEDSTFSGMKLHDNVRGAGISLDLNFNHNVVSNTVLTGNDLGIFMRSSRDNVFQGLVIRDSRHHGVFMAQAGDNTPDGWQLTPGTECTGNKFTKLDITSSGGKAFLVNNKSCKNNEIIAANFQNDSHGMFAEAVPHLVLFRTAP